MVKICPSDVFESVGHNPGSSGSALNKVAMVLPMAGATALGNQIDVAMAARKVPMHNDRFDAITAELERLAMEIAAINRQPFDTRIDLRSITEKTESEEELPLISVNDWRLHR